MDPSSPSPEFGKVRGRQFISNEAKAVLVEQVLNCETALATQRALASIGVEKSLRSVMMWMKWTREWLGLPPLYPSTKSERYREMVVKWIMKNGLPSPQQIIAGWTPPQRQAGD